MNMKETKKEGAPMEKGKLIGKTLGIALVSVLIGVMLGGLLVATSPFAEFANRSQALAQGLPELEWSKTFGNLGDDFGDSVQQTSDGGYVIAGFTESYGAGGEDVWLIKTDSNGNKTWDKTFGGTSDDAGWSVQQTSDGGYVIAGSTSSYGAGGEDVWLIKIDSNGNKAWDKTFGGTSFDDGESVQQTSDSGYVIAGSTSSYGAGEGDVWLIKTDSNGNKVWDKTFGGTSDDAGWSVQQTSDGSYIVAGFTESYGAGGEDVWLIKTDSNGNKVWDKTFGGTSFDDGESAQQTSDGGYVIAGFTESYGAGGEDAWLIKTDSNGNKIWDKTFGGTSDDAGWSVQQTSDGGYIVAGGTSSYGAGGEDVWLIKTDSNGNKVWDKTFGGTADDDGISVQQTSDDGYVIAGVTGSYGAGNEDVWLIRLGPEGGVQNTPPNIPSNPSPANHATDAPINADLSWTGGDPDAGNTVTCNVYFGTSPTEPMAMVSHNQTGTSYAPGTLAYNTTYYWKIVATDSQGASTTGPLWDFTTVHKAEVPGTPTWVRIIAVAGTVLLVAIIVGVIRRKLKAQHSQ
jgi:predicted secreted protein